MQAILVADLVVALENGRITYCGKASGLPSSFLDDELPKNERILPVSQSLSKSDSSSINTLEKVAPKEGTQATDASLSPTSFYLSCGAYSSQVPP